MAQGRQTVAQQGVALQELEGARPRAPVEAYYSRVAAILGVLVLPPSRPDREHLLVDQGGRLNSSFLDGMRRVGKQCLD